MNNANDGFLDVLNCGAGHLQFKFDKNSPEEVEKARKVLTDMLKRGYMLFVEVEGKQRRVRTFDPTLDEYILEEPDDEPSATKADEKPQETAATPTRVPMRKARATAVGPIAGG